ncbi:MAG: LacI family DNA-binding transcriptional regulator [Prolixibacteraceae bacterium]
MPQKVTLKSIAAELNLSMGTVSRILNGKAREFRISKETVELVLKYAKDKGYSPNLIAKGLQASKTFTIGLMIPDIANPFFALMAKHIERAASQANYSILLIDAEENSDKEEKQVNIMMSRKVDGIIAAPVGKSFEHFRKIVKQGIPLIFVDRYFKNIDIPYITSDNFMGGYKACKHLIENGHQRIGLIRGDESTEPVIERKNGYRKALEEAGIDVQFYYETGTTFSFENGYESALQLLSLPQPPTALITMSNLLGLGAIKAIRELQLNLPNDVSLVVYDDQPYASYLNPPITTVKQDSEQMGKLAIAYILKKIDNEYTEFESVHVPIQLIFRDSVHKIN